MKKHDPCCGPQQGKELRPQYGLNALQCCGVELPVQVLRSQAGFYIGTMDSDGPVSRESAEYYKTVYRALQALRHGSWTQHYD